MNLGYAIKHVRGSRFTQKEIAELTGVTNVYVSLVENNKRECSLSWLRKFAEVTGKAVPAIFYLALDSRDKPASCSDLTFDLAKLDMDVSFKRIFDTL